MIVDIGINNVDYVFIKIGGVNIEVCIVGGDL